MHLFILIIVLGLVAHDQYGSSRPLPVTGAELAAIVILPKLALAAFYAALCGWAHRALVRRQQVAWIARVDRASTAYRLVVLGLFGLDLYAGLLIWIRTSTSIGDMVLVDETGAMAPTLAMLCFSWWMYYPIDRRLREATVMRRIDEGLPVYPIWTRGQYMLGQLRHQVALMLLPLMAIMAWLELAGRYTPQGLRSYSALIVFFGAGAVFVVTPLVIRHIWDTIALPEGPLREMLVGMCTRYRVRVRQLLLWRTFGGVINAAVMGIFAPFRYILLSDALLDMMPTREIEAVMAHELGHVRKHHMFWLLIVASASSIAVNLAAFSLIASIDIDSGNTLVDETWITAAVGAVSVACWLLIFGWASRRFERQADTFAVQHLSHPESTVTADATDTMISALGHVASLNHIPATKRSWRHGSIAWRQNYLRSLIGRPVNRLAIDTHIRAIKLCGALVLVVTLTLVWWLGE